MSKLLQSVAMKNDAMHEFNVLTKWNEKQKDNPLNCFNHSWLKKNVKREEKYLSNITKRIQNELGSNCSSLVANVLAMYDEREN